MNPSTTAPLMVSISGLRGIVGESLTPDVITRYISGFSSVTPEGPIVLGWDGRAGGAVIERLVSAVLSACGRDVFRIGIAPTPTVQFAVESLSAAGGIAVTASHNPSQWNGLKFISDEGLFLDEEQSKIFWNAVALDGRTYAGWERLGKISEKRSIHRRHIQAVLSLPYISVPSIRRRKFSVVVDAVNASGSTIVPSLLKQLGCRVIPLFCDGTGLFPHTPEPITDNLGELARAVKRSHADLGIAVDPDADRLVLIMDNGKPFGEEYTVTAAVRFMLRTIGLKNQLVIVNLSTTRAVDDVAAAFHATVQRTSVGEIHVARAMKTHGALIGGEGNGGVILPDVHYGRDSLVGIALILQELNDRKQSLRQYRASLPRYVMVKQKFPIDGIDSDRLLRRIAETFRDEQIDDRDGLRIDFRDGWIQIRKSNTEPIVRLFAEARDEKTALGLIEKISPLLRS